MGKMIFELWEAGSENWPRIGDDFRVGKHVGKCISEHIDYENTSAVFVMEVADGDC